jgi:hypothetical protein
MKTTFMGVLLLASSLMLSAQDKPRVFVQGKGSQDVNSSGSSGGGQHWGVFNSRSTIDSHDESMEVTKDLQKSCSGVIITLNASNADYTVMLNRESKKNRGLLRSNSQVEVANRGGDVIGTNATHTVGNASKDACQLILADWQAHGKSAAPAAQPAAATPAAPMATPAVTAEPVVSPQHATIQATAAVQPGQVVTVSDTASQTQTSSSTGTTNGGTGNDAASLADAARRAKQHAACLQLAKDNPSISCN